MWSCYFSIALGSYILTLCSFESAVGVVDLLECVKRATLQVEFLRMQM